MSYSKAEHPSNPYAVQVKILKENYSADFKQKVFKYNPVPANEIQVWKMKRQEVSERNDAIDYLEKFLLAEMRKITPEPVNRAIKTFCYSIVSRPFFDFDLTGLLDGLAVFN